MASTKRRTRIAALASLTATFALVIPAAASASIIPAPAATPYNSTPSCPVSATSQVCVWNVPVDTNNVFSALDYGQCPYWAAEKYPALVLGELLSDPLGTNWDGGTWLEHALEEGLGASTTPASGDLAVWQSEPTDTPGHVAYVEAVIGNSIIVSQMDGNSSGQFPSNEGTTEWIGPAALSYFESAYGLQFISTGNASSTPLANVELPADTSTSTAAITPAGSSVAATQTATKTVTKSVTKKKVVKKTVKKKTAKKKAAKKKPAKHTAAKKTSTTAKAAAKR